MDIACVYLAVSKRLWVVVFCHVCACHTYVLHIICIRKVSLYLHR